MKKLIRIMRLCLATDALDQRTILTIDRLNEIHSKSLCNRSMYEYPVMIALVNVHNFIEKHPTSQIQYPYISPACCLSFHKHGKYLIQRTREGGKPFIIKNIICFLLPLRFQNG